MPPSYRNMNTLRALTAYYLQKTGSMAYRLPPILVQRMLTIIAFIKLVLNRHPFVLPYLELCITERCSLRCKNCANLIPRYKVPADYDTLRILSSVDRLLNSVDYINCFRILGGEPFLHSDIAHIIRYCTFHKKIGQVQVVTNGTIIPEEEVFAALEHPQASVYISNYGPVSNKFAFLEEKLRKHRIIFCSDRDYTWDNMGGLERRNYSLAQVKLVYRECREICKTMVDGVIYVCPRAAHGDKLGLIPSRSEDCVDIFAESALSARKKLRALYDVDYIESCYYCNAINDRTKIAAGTQSVGESGSQYGLAKNNE